VGKGCSIQRWGIADEWCTVWGPGAGGPAAGRKLSERPCCAGQKTIELRTMPWMRCCGWRPRAAFDGVSVLPSDMKSVREGRADFGREGSFCVAGRKRCVEAGGFGCLLNRERS